MAKKTTSRKPIRVLKKKTVKAPSKKKVQEVEAAPKMTFESSKHSLVPKHEVLDQEAVEELFTSFKVSPQNLPVILVNDAAIAHLGVKMGDIIRISRKSPTAGTAVFYRRVAYE